MPNKAMAAGGTTALAGAITTVIIALAWPGASPEIATAITTVIAAVLSFVATYFTRAEKRTA